MVGVRHGAGVQSFLPPEHARLPPSREWMLRGVILAGMVAAVLVPVTWWLGVWGGSEHQLRAGGSYEHQLRAAVRHGYCEGHAGQP